MCFLVVVFFFKQKTAYEMRISDWSSDVCSSDLANYCIPDLGCPYDISEPVTGGLYKLPNVLIQCRRKPLPPATLCNPPCGYPKYILPEDPNFCVLDNGALSFAGSYQLSDASTSGKILVDPLDRKISGEGQRVTVRLDSG